MNVKKRTAVILSAIAALLALFIGEFLLMRSYIPPILEGILDWMFAPSRSDTISESGYCGIEKYLGITLPEEAEFVEKITLYGQDCTHFYIFEFALSDRKPAETVDAFLRRMLSLDESRYSRTSEIDPDDTLTWGPTLSELGYSASYCIDRLGWGFSHIYYDLADENTLRVILIYSV